MTPEADEFDDLEAGLDLADPATTEPEPAPKARKTRKPAAKQEAAPRKRAEPEILEKIDPRVPPVRVKHLPSGRITNWSPLFRRRVQDFTPFYRDDEERMEHRVAIKQAQIMGDPQAMARAIIEQMANEGK